MLYAASSLVAVAAFCIVWERCVMRTLYVHYDAENKRLRAGFCAFGVFLSLFDVRTANRKIFNEMCTACTKEFQYELLPVRSIVFDVGALEYVHLARHIKFFVATLPQRARCVLNVGHVATRHPYALRSMRARQTSVAAAPADRAPPIS